MTEIIKALWYVILYVAQLGTIIYCVITIPLIIFNLIYWILDYISQEDKSNGFMNMYVWKYFKNVVDFISGIPIIVAAVLSIITNPAIFPHVYEIESINNISISRFMYDFFTIHCLFLLFLYIRFRRNERRK